ncbi:hypothetical protein E4T39_05173 [Aureobasidium subglaciale]|nr:hypothetical protein E4T39_05173 [Aureobasidium subglaciale]
MVRITGPILFVAALCTFLFTHPVIAESEIDWQKYRLQCHVKDFRILQATERLCSRNLHVPSGVGQVGEAYDRNQRLYVIPNTRCLMDGRMNSKSNVWVPKYWCERQFWKTCAQGGPKGRGSQIFGGKGCQKFLISNFPD